MKRDLDLVREVLLQLEAQDHVGEIAGRTPQEVAYHVSLLEGAGLVTQELYTNMYLNDSLLDGIRITWSGHEFLDASRSKPTWEKAKQIVIQKTGVLSFELVKTVLVQLAKQALEVALSPETPPK
jgi:hypothetical protein